MLLPVQLSFPLFYEITGLDQRKVRNDTQCLFKNFFLRLFSQQASFSEL